METEISSGFVTVNPATGEEITQYEYMSDVEAIEAVEKCHNAFLLWRMQSLEERASCIQKIGEGLQKYKSEFAALMTREMGKIQKQGLKEIDLCSEICKYTANEGKESLSDEVRELPNGGKGIITYAPIGVIYGIQPWNYPAYQAVRFSIANLMAGNGVLLKHAENVTGSALLLQKIYEEAGLPKHLFTVLRIDHDQSDRILEHDYVRGVTLTGSSKAGKIIAEKAGKALKKTVLELGSNDAYLILDDADIKFAAETCIKGRIYNNGETCIAAKRFVVVASVYDEFKEAFVSGMKKIKAGDPTHEDSDIGPMAREDLRDKLHDQD